jgi:Fe-S cluster assembly protein SufD
VNITPLQQPKLSKKAYSTEGVTWFSSEFEKIRQHLTSVHERPHWLNGMRQAALDRLLTRGFPTTKHEHWKNTNLSSWLKRPLSIMPFRPVGVGLRTQVTRTIVDRLYCKEKTNELVFINGHFLPEFSRFCPLHGRVIIRSMSETLSSFPEEIEPYFREKDLQLKRLPLSEGDSWADLNTAVFQDGAYIYLSQETELQEPIQLIFLSIAEDSPRISHARNLIVAAAGSKATVIETHLTLAAESGISVASATNAVTEVMLGENAKIDFLRLTLDEPSSALHIGSLYVQQKAASKFNSYVLTCGGGITRNNVHVALEGDQAECKLYGLYAVSEKQHVDHYTLIDHVHPGAKSEELYKGVLGGAAKGVFSGKIIVRHGAHGSDATQLNKNLLLSESASIHTRPQLEIYNDDVKCKHGATSGAVDDDALFYLRSRGFNEQQARLLLVDAFSDEVLSHIPLETIRNRMKAALSALYPSLTVALPEAGVLPGVLP